MLTLALANGSSLQFRDTDQDDDLLGTMTCGPLLAGDDDEETHDVHERGGVA